MNPQPLKHESSPITSRPGLQPNKEYICSSIILQRLIANKLFIFSDDDLLRDEDNDALDGEELLPVAGALVQVPIVL